MTPGPLNEDERSELERLRAENAALRRRPVAWRSPLAAFLIVAGCVLAPLPVLAVWAANQVSDTGRYVANVAPLISEPPIQNALSDKITSGITAQLNVEQLARQAAAALSARGLPRAGALLNTFSGTLNDAVTGFIHSQVTRVLAGPRAAALWVQLNQAAHAELVKALSGTGGSAINSHNGQVSANLGPFIRAVQADLSSHGFALASKLPPVNPTIALFSSRDLVRAQTGYRLIYRLKFVLPLVTVLFLGLGVYLARDHRRALLGASLGVAAAMVALGAGLQIARGAYLSSVPSSALPSDAAAALFDTLVRFIKDGLRILLVLGLAVAAGAFLAGPSVSAVRFRAVLVAGLVRLRRFNVLNASLARWTSTHRTALRISSAALAALIFVLFPSAAAAIVLTVLLVLVLGFIELASRAGPASE